MKTILVVAAFLGVGSAHATVLSHFSDLRLPAMVLQGTPVFNANPASVDMGPVAVGVSTPVFGTPPPFAEPLQISNTGSAPLTSNFSFSSPEFGFDSATTISSPLTVAAGSSVTGGLAFKPTAAGPRTGQFVSNDNAAGSPHSVALSGTGITVANNDFGIVLDPSEPSTIVLKAGQTTTFKMWVLAGPGLNASFSVVGSASCTGGPRGSTCSVSPQTSSAGFNQQSSRGMMTVSVALPAAAAASRHGLPAFWGFACLPALWLIYRSRKAVIPSLAVFGLLATMTFMIACGGGSGSSNASPLAITVQAIGLGVTHTTMVPVSVQ
ncbi:MAG: hypothetical protein ACXWBH_10065 [Candidatus Angelobacter sp.]